MAETDRRCVGRPLSLENRVDCMRWQMNVNVNGLHETTFRNNSRKAH